jgi:DivIVA domain-containing protein
MDQLLLPVLGVLVVGAVGFGVALLLSGRDPGLQRVEPDGRAVPLPASRPLVETDIDAVRFDAVLRGYRMDQVDAALRRAGYDIGYKEELIQVLEAEVEALRAGRVQDADTLRRARISASGHAAPTVHPPPPEPATEPPAAEPADEIDLGLELGREADRDEWSRQETKLG